MKEALAHLMATENFSIIRIAKMTDLLPQDIESILDGNRVSKKTILKLKQKLNIDV